MEQAKNETTSVALEMIITNAVKIPGVKVNRSKFLAEAFAGDDIDLQTIIDMGPVSAGIPQERIEKAATKLIFVRTSQSSVASFVAGIPGGFAMGATIPADVAQFFGIALRLAQELSYLYGASDLWTEDQLDDERVRNQLILYCGVMFGVSGAVSGVRVLSTQIAKARQNTAYADRIGLSYSLVMGTQLESGIMQAFLTPHTEKTDKTANNAKS